MKQVVLVGLMGSGKSTVGRTIAERTGRRIVDTDVRIESSTGQTVRELWEAGGEDAYRSLESKLVLDGLQSSDGVVIAAPGGVICDDKVIEALFGHHVGWLRARPQTLASRVRPDDHRPLLGDRPLEVLTQMEADRSALYKSVATAIIDVDDMAPDEAATRLIQKFGLNGRPVP